MKMYEGGHTAIVTPMDSNRNIDYDKLNKLLDFQKQNGITGVLAVGTTGESGTLSWEEHINVIEFIHNKIGNKGITIGGTGSNNTSEAFKATKHADNIGVESVLLVEPYYNGPSSKEIRKEYIAPIAEEFEDLEIIPYVIPGRSGTQLYPQDLAILNSEHKNINAVKEATGDLDNMKITRELCGENFHILSGDDSRTFEMMISDNISASGAISVASNVAPRAVQNMIDAINDGDIEKASEINKAISPLMDLVTVNTMEETKYGEVICKARNPLPYKTLMNILGMPSGPCRSPLGKMTRKGVQIVLDKVRKVYEQDPQILTPIEDFFSVDLEERLYNYEYLNGLYYD